MPPDVLNRQPLNVFISDLCVADLPTAGSVAWGLKDIVGRKRE